MSMPERQPRNLAELERRAIADHHAARVDFISGGAQDEVTLRRNRSAFESVNPADVVLERCSQSRPVHYGPGREDQSAGDARPDRTPPDGASRGSLADGAGSRLIWNDPGGRDRVIGRHRGYRRRSPPAPSGSATHTSRDVTEMLVRRAEQAGYRVLCICVDIPVLSPLERAMRHGWKYPPGFPLRELRGRRCGHGDRQREPGSTVLVPTRDDPLHVVRSLLGSDHHESPDRSEGASNPRRRFSGSRLWRGGSDRLQPRRQAARWDTCLHRDAPAHRRGSERPG